MNVSTSPLVYLTTGIPFWLAVSENKRVIDKGISKDEE